MKANRPRRPLLVIVLGWLKKIVALPQFDDEEQNQLARTFNILMIGIFLAAAVGVAATAAKGQGSQALALVVTALISLGLQVLMRMKWLRLAIFLAFVSLLVLTTFLLYRGGVHDLAVMIYPGVIVLAGLLTRPKEFVAIIILSILSVVFIIHAEISGLITSPASPGTSYFDILSISAILIVTGLGVRLFLRAGQRSLERIREKEREVAEREERYRRLIEMSPDGIAIVDLNGVIVSCNRRVVELLGFTGVEELVNRNAFEYVAFEEHDRVRRHLVSALDHPLARQVEYWFVRSDRSRFLGELSASLILDANQKPLHFVTIIRDVTERKNAEEERKRLEVDMRQTQKMESLGTLAGGIAHDFNNILSIIIGHADVLLKSLKDQPNVRKTLQTITEAAERGAAMVKQILTFARKSEADFKTVDVVQVISGLVKMLGMTFPRTVEIEFKSQPDLPQAYLDPAQLHQALLNLCINARDAMAGKGKLTISADLVDGREIVSRFPDADEQRLIRIQIADTGVGLDEKTRGRIFEPFFTTKGRGKGTGLGLSVVYGVVQAHRGFIDFVSQPGRGTTFSLFFPISAHRPAAVEPVPDQGDVPSGDEMILVVEDEESLRELLVTALQDHGYGVITARDGIEALERYRRHQGQIGLVITDMDLPKINGAAVSQSILGDDPNANIIMISGFIDAALKASILSHGVREFVAKPYSLAQMLRTIRRVLDSEKRSG